MPTRRGWALLGACVGSFLAARITSAREMYSIAVACAALIVLSTVIVRRGSYRLQVQRRVGARRVFPGARFRVRLAIRNLGRLRTPPLLLEDDAAPPIGGPARFWLTSLPASTVATVEGERTATARGRYTVGPVRIRLVDPFGLAERIKTLEIADTVMVYPRIEVLGRGAPPADRAGSGPAALSRPVPGGDEFYAVREYESGDDLRKIHWRSVAKTGQLMIRQEEARLYPRATVLLDARRAVHRGAGRESSLEWAVSAAASAIWHLAANGFALRLATDESDPSAYRTSTAAAESLLESLAVLNPSRVPGLRPVVRNLLRRPDAGGALLAILPPPSRDDVRALARLRAVYGWCTAVLLDTESFVQPTARERAGADQRLAAAEIDLLRAGWRVGCAGSRERFQDLWQELTLVSRPRSSSRRS